MYRLSIFALIALFFIASCSSKDCTEISVSFSSYRQAKSEIRAADFLLKEEANTSRSSWIRSATYYSCDMETGFFEIETDKGNHYIFKDLPISVWEEFKTAKSLGKFYNQNIRGRYQLLIEE